MRRLKMQPLPTRMKPTRTSLRVRAIRMSLLYFSYTTGTKRRNRARKIPEMLTKIAKPERPAVQLSYISMVGVVAVINLQGPIPHFA
jgi:hypothetical protein